MKIGVRYVAERFGLLYENLWDRNFRKSLPMHDYGERHLLPLVRTFLLGAFGSDLKVEAQATLPGASNGTGRLDFVVGGVAVEFAVRRPKAAKGNLSSVTNTTEIKKLMKHNGQALLVLYDFSRSPFAEDEIDSYREWPSLGKGNHKKSPFNVAYYFISGKRPITTAMLMKNIRVG